MLFLGRTWFLLSLLALGAAFGAAAGSNPETTAALSEARQAAAEAEARWLLSRLSAARAAQRSAAESLSRDPRIQAAMSAVSPRMAPHIVAALLSEALEKVGADHPSLGLALVDAESGLRAATGNAKAVSARLAASAVAKAALAGATRDGPLGGSGSRWLAAAAIPVAGGEATLALVTVAGPPAAVLAEARGSAARTTLVTLVGGAPGSEADATARAIAEGTTPEGRDGAPIAAIAGPDGPLKARQFAVPGPGDLAFALAWPDPPPQSALTRLGDGTLLATLEPTLAVQLGLGVAGGLWLIGLLLSILGQTRPVRRLAHTLDTWVPTPGEEPVQAAAFPGWLRPAARAASDLVERLAAEVEKRRDEVEAAKKKAASNKKPAARKKPAAEKAPAKKTPAKKTPAAENAPAKKKPAARKKPAAKKAAAASTDRSSAARKPARSTTPEQAPTEDRDPETVAKPKPQRRPPKVSPPDDDDHTMPRIDVSGEMAVLSTPGEPTQPEGGTDPSFGHRGVALPALEDDDADDDHTDSGIKVPKPRSDGPRAQPPSLLSALQAHGELQETRGEPTRKTALPSRPPRTESTAVRAVPIELLDASRASPEVDDSPDQDTYYRGVFDEFVARKTECGERTDNLDFEKFKSRLKQTRASLMERFGCEDVRFRVYIKDGRAALKAAPVLPDEE